MTIALPASSNGPRVSLINKRDDNLEFHLQRLSSIKNQCSDKSRIELALRIAVVVVFSISLMLAVANDAAIIAVIGGGLSVICYGCSFRLRKSLDRAAAELLLEASTRLTAVLMSQTIEDVKRISQPTLDTLESIAIDAAYAASSGFHLRLALAVVRVLGIVGTDTTAARLAVLLDREGNPDEQQPLVEAIAGCIDGINRRTVQQAADAKLLRPALPDGSARRNLLNPAGVLADANPETLLRPTVAVSAGRP